MDGSSFLASFSSDHEIRFNGGTIDSFPVRGEKVFQIRTFLSVVILFFNLNDLSSFKYVKFGAGFWFGCLRIMSWDTPCV